MKKLIEYIKAFFSPAPATEWELRCRDQKRCEEAYNELLREIEASNSLKELYAVEERIHTYKMVWGNRTQTRAHVDSLLIEVYSKQNSIIKKL